MNFKEKIWLQNRKKELIKIQEENPADAGLKEIVNEELLWIEEQLKKF